MNDPLLGPVIGIIGTVCIWTGYRFGCRAGQQHTLIKLGLAKPDTNPRTKASWLRRNWFRPAVEDRQRNFDFFRS